MLAKMRSDRHKKPVLYEYRVLSNDECRSLSGACHILDDQGDIANVKITSVKTWKRTPDRIEVNCKYGLYEFFAIHLSDCKQNSELIELVQ